MIKWIIRIFLIYIVLTGFSLFYLSFYGIETDYFNSAIQKKVGKKHVPMQKELVTESKEKNNGTKR